MFPSVVPLHRTASYALLTRPPLIKGASSFSPFDLHVLGTPPAFVLSQDQTLRLILGRNSLSFTGSAFSSWFLLFFALIHLSWYLSAPFPLPGFGAQQGIYYSPSKGLSTPFFTVFLIFFEFLCRAGCAAFIFCLFRFFVCVCKCLHGFVYFFFVFFWRFFSCFFIFWLTNPGSDCNLIIRGTYTPQQRAKN